MAGFADPPTHVKPYVRWWWPHGAVELDEIRKEVHEIADAGFGGVEIQDAHHSIETGTNIQTETHGWGSQPWIDAFITAIESSNERGLVHDTAFGPSWPAAVPSVGADDITSMKEIIMGYDFTQHGKEFSAPIPPPYFAADPAVHNKTLNSIFAWKLNESYTSKSNPIYLEYGTQINLSNSVRDGNVTFSPPDNGTWLIYSTWWRGTGEQPEDYPHSTPTSYAVDFFSKEGAQAVIDYWESHIFSDRMLSELSKMPTAFMEDSLELVSRQFWSPKFSEEFQQRRGYDVNSILPTITTWVDDNYYFDFGDSSIREHALNDYLMTLSDMFIDNHVTTLKNWVNGHGFDYRLQAYDSIVQLDGMKASSVADIPEGEALGFLYGSTVSQIDNFRGIAGAVNMAGKKRFSNELGGYREHAYQTTWVEITRTLNPELAAGVNQNILHGYSYIWAPTALWPGWTAFGLYQGKYGYSDSWGSRHPIWRHVQDWTTYVARNQFILQRGVAKYDVALYRPTGSVKVGYRGPYFTSEGAMEGWSAVYIDGSLLNLDSAHVEHGRLAPDAGNYSLVVISADEAFGHTSSMLVEDATRLYSLAKDGLPILIVGDWSNATSWGLHDRCNVSVVSIISKMAKFDHVVSVDNATEIPHALEQMKLKPAVRYESSSLIGIHHEDDQFDHFYFTANSSKHSVNQLVSVPLRQTNFVPVQLDAWTGKATVLAQYAFLDDDRMEFPVNLEPGSSTIISLVPVDGSRKTVPHVVYSTADSIIRDAGNRLLVRSSEAGVYNVTLDNGTTKTVEFDDIPSKRNLTSWTLEVDSWEPADGTGRRDVTATVLKRHAFNLTSLEPWTEMDALKDVSGNATYTTHFELNTANQGLGAYLDIGKFNESMRLTVNDQQLPPFDQLGTRIDITDWLNNGTNKLDIDISTTLYNRLRILEPGIYLQDRQDCGLTAVVLHPFRQEYLD